MKYKSIISLLFIIVLWFMVLKKYPIILRLE